MTPADLRAAIRTDWRPIETVPKGEVLLYFPAKAGRNALVEMWCVGRANAFPYRRPTHWMPLPEAPDDAG